MFTLMYHRISKPDTNPWGVCVSPQHFEEQIEWLTGNFPVITPDKLWQSMQEGTLADNSVLITFDDGYQDNFTNARPVLEKYRCPATFFVPTASIDSGKSFWWDELEWILLHSPTLPDELRIVVDSTLFMVNIGQKPLTKSDYQQHLTWRWHEDPPTDRCAAFLNLWQLLRPLPQKEIDLQMKFIRKWSGRSIANLGFRLPIRKPQLLKMIGNPLFSFGLHTHNHADLSNLNKEEQAAEIGTADYIFKKEYGVSTAYFAYPYGMYSPATLELMDQYKMRLGFTTQPEPVVPTTNPFLIGRLQVEDVDLAHFQKHYWELQSKPPF